MDINYFDQIWNRKKTDKIASQAFWDSRAEEFNLRVNTSEGEKRLNKILKLLTSQGILTGEGDVLDIGCGPGKYAIEIAKKAKSVIGVDISPRMIEYAKENAAIERLFNMEFKVADWEVLDINSLGWDKRFDLVVAAMCPAINNKAALEKMINASRGYCFLSNFVERTDSVKDYISKNIVCKNVKSKYGTGIYCSFNILCLMGIYPEIAYMDTVWEHVMPIKKAVNFYYSYFKMTQKLSLEHKLLIQNYLEQISENGLVRETVKAKIAYLTWKV